MSTEQNTATNAGGNQSKSREAILQLLKSGATRKTSDTDADALKPGRLVHKRRETFIAVYYGKCAHVYTITEHKHVGLMPLDEYELVPVSHAHGETESLPLSSIVPLGSPLCDSHIHCPNTPLNWDPQAINLPAHTGHHSTSDMEGATQADFEEMPFAGFEDLD